MVCLRQFASATLAFAALTGQASAQNASASDVAIAANLEHYWSYGRSPPVYPTPQGAGLGDWASAYAQARALVAQMTNDEKNNITYGYTSTTNGCSGNNGGVNRLGYPGMCLSDSGNGLRGTDGVNGYPSGLHIGASWNKSLAYARAQHMGAEFKRKGVNMALGPVVGPLGRIARGGRNWEGFSNDPYLSGQLVYPTIQGLQESVIACVKHLIGNEQETNRNPPILDPTAFNVSVSSNIDDKTLHELYLWPFQDAIRAGAGSVMCSYNQVNGSYACQNSKVLNGLLKGELGFQGFVVSDWAAQHTGVASAAAGLDMAMPDSPYWELGNLSLAVSNGSLAQSRLDDMATRILAPWFKYAHFANPGSGMPIDLLAAHEFVDGRDPSSTAVLLQGAVEGHVLVKNVNNALPLNKPKLLSLFGYDGLPYAQNEPGVGAFNKWPFGLTNTQEIEGSGPFEDTLLLEVFLSSAPPGTAVPGVALNGTMITGGGSGATTPAYVDAPYDAFLRQARTDGTWLAWDFYNQNVTVNGASDACIVFVNELASEGWDRPYLADPYSDILIENVASKCNNTIVVIHNAGIRLVDAWIDNPNITAVLYAHLPGQESGQALVDVMYGAQSPSGRLPYTVAKQASDYGTLLNPTLPDDATLWHPLANFTEGVYIDYRYFLAHNITPRYSFGYGLTYTTFAYSGLKTSVSSTNATAGSCGHWYSNEHSNATTTSTTSSSSSSTSTVAEGGDPTLWNTVASVSATITNTGKVAAAEVAQLYVHIPGGPAKVLRGFEKVFLTPGASATVTFDLTRKDLSEWDVVSQSWVLQSGAYGVYVGKSVLDTQLSDNINI